MNNKQQTTNNKQQTTRKGEINMLNLREAQITVQKVNGKYNVSIYKTTRWTDIYNSAEEIVEDLKQIHIPEEKELYLLINIYKGWEYIHSFAKQVQNGKILSPKQITMCKRMALEIKKAYEIRNCWN